MNKSTTIKVGDKKVGKPPKPYKYLQVRKRLEQAQKTLKKRLERLDVLHAEVDYLRKRIQMYEGTIGL